MAKITFTLPDDSKQYSVEVTKGESLLEAAQKANLPIESVCGGCCSCGICHVLVVSGGANLSSAEHDEKDLLNGSNNSSAFSRLACQCKAIS